MKDTMNLLGLFFFLILFALLFVFSWKEQINFALFVFDLFGRTTVK